jgi:hypothetical protein
MNAIANTSVNDVISLASITHLTWKYASLQIDLPLDTQSSLTCIQDSVELAQSY